MEDCNLAMRRNNPQKSQLYAEYFDVVKYYAAISSSDIYAWEQKTVPDSRFLIVDFLLRMPVSRPGTPCEICGRQIANGNDCSSSATDFPCQLTFEHFVCVHAATRGERRGMMNCCRYAVSCG
jgi:hypothetical protein